jgi:tetratricopeptide (TPR) repeat protein
VSGSRQAGPAHPGPRWWEIPRPLAGLLIAAAAARAVYFYLLARHSIFFEGLILDSEVYDGWARSIASGEWIGREAFYLPPFYPYLLGIVFRLFGHSVALVYLGQALLGLVNLALIHRIGTAVVGERAGLLAASGAALYAPFAFFEMKVLSTTVGLTLSLVALLALVRAEERAAWGPRSAASARGWVAAGLLIGVAALCLPASVLLALLYAGVRAARRGFKEAGLLLAGTLAALLPVVAHNLYVAADPLPLSGQGGITFYQGNNPGSMGLYNVVPGFSGSPELQPKEEKEIAERETGRVLRRSEVSAHFFRKGLGFIVSQPGRWLVLEARKLGALLGDYEASTEHSLYLERRQVPWLRLLGLPFAAIAGLGLAGAMTARVPDRPAPGGTALRVYTLYAAAVPLMFYVSSRYRLPLVPALLIYGAAFVDRAARQVRAAGAMDTAHARALAAAVLLFLISFFPLGRPSATAEANVHYNIGNLLAEAGRHEEAIAAFDRSLADWPGNAFALINRGNSLDRLGLEDEALASYRRAEEARPGFWTACKAQGIILHRRQRYEEEAEAYHRGLAGGGAESQFLLGATLLRLGREDEAAGRLLEAVRIDPAHLRAHLRLGEIYARRGDAGRARDHYRRALATDPGNSAAQAGLSRLPR